MTLHLFLRPDLECMMGMFWKSFFVDDSSSSMLSKNHSLSSKLLTNKQPRHIIIIVVIMISNHTNKLLNINALLFLTNIAIVEAKKKVRCTAKWCSSSYCNGKFCYDSWDLCQTHRYRCAKVLDNSLKRKWGAAADSIGRNLSGKISSDLGRKEYQVGSETNQYTRNRIQEIGDNSKSHLYFEWMAFYK